MTKDKITTQDILKMIAVKGKKKPHDKWYPITSIPIESTEHRCYQ